MTVTEKIVVCTICESFKRFSFSPENEPNMEDIGWLKFTVDTGDGAKTKHICPDCLAVFKGLFDRWYNDRIPNPIEVITEEPKKRGRPPKKKD